MFNLFKKKKHGAARSSNMTQGVIGSSAGPEDNVAQHEKFLQLLLKSFDADAGNHPQTVLCALGALAGFSAQMGLRETQIQSGKLQEWQVFKKIDGLGGHRYYESEKVFNSLFRIKMWDTSIYRMMRETTEELGHKDDYDIPELVDHVERCYGSDEFSLSHVMPKDMPRYNPVYMLKDSWDPLCLCLRMFDEGRPATWPVTIGAIARRYIYTMRDKIDPAMIVPLVMGSALAMSRIDPKLVCGQSTAAGPKILDFSRTEFGQLLTSEEFSRAMENARAA